MLVYVSCINVPYVVDDWCNRNRTIVTFTVHCSPFTVHCCSDMTETIRHSFVHSWVFLAADGTGMKGGRGRGIFLGDGKSSSKLQRASNFIPHTYWGYSSSYYKRPTKSRKDRSILYTYATMKMSRWVLLPRVLLLYKSTRVYKAKYEVFCTVYLINNDDSNIYELTITSLTSRQCLLLMLSIQSVFPPLHIPLPTIRPRPSIGG